MSEMKFSELIEEISERNDNLSFGLEDIVGVTIEKGLIPTIANLTQTALDKFYIVKPDTFVYNPRTHGVRLGMGFNETEKTFITSWNNIAFRVKDAAQNKVLSKFLWIYFNRAEWDRQTNFLAWGSSTIVFAWNDFLNIKINLPDIKEQQKIVDTYNAITNRIQIKQKINENLEKTAQLMFDELFMKPDSDFIELDEIVEVNPERTLKKGYKYKCFEMATLPVKNAIPSSFELKEYNGGMKFRNGDTIMARITPCLENGKAAYINLLENDEIAFGSTEYIVLSSKRDLPSSFNYFLVRNEDFITYAKKHMNGSSGRQRVSGEDIAKYKIHKPNKDDLIKFDLLASKTLLTMKESNLEINKLEQLRDMVVSKISKR